MRPVELYILFISCHWNIAFQMPASLRMCKTQTLLTAPHPISKLEQGQPKDVHICKRQPCAATFSSGLICPPLTSWTFGPAARKQRPPLLAEFAAGAVQS